MTLEANKQGDQTGTKTQMVHSLDILESFSQGSGDTVEHIYLGSCRLDQGYKYHRLNLGFQNETLYRLLAQEIQSQMLCLLRSATRGSRFI